MRRGYTVFLGNALREEVVYEVKDLSTEERLLTILHPSGLSEITEIGTDGVRTTTLPDGTVASLTEGPEAYLAGMPPAASIAFLVIDSTYAVSLRDLVRRPG